MGTYAGVSFTTPKGLPSSTVLPELPHLCTCVTIGHVLLSMSQLAAHSNLKFSLPVVVEQKTSEKLRSQEKGISGEFLASSGTAHLTNRYRILFTR